MGSRMVGGEGRGAEVSIGYFHLLLHIHFHEIFNIMDKIR